MPASVYVTDLASGLVKDGVTVLYVDPQHGKIAYLDKLGNRVHEYARFIRGKLTISQKMVWNG
jgi:hypothetical protein